MTTKFPSTLILMELAEELSAKNCELQLQWIRRDLNQLADDLTNENFASFDPNFQGGPETGSARVESARSTLSPCDQLLRGLGLGL